MKKKIKIGNHYKLVETPLGKNSSRNGNFSTSHVTIVEVISINGDAHNIRVLSVDGTPKCETTSGWVYAYELEAILMNAETISEEIACLENEKIELDSTISILKSKLEFINTQGIEEFNDEEFKAYLVLKELGIDDFAKAKNIVKILGK